MRILVLTTLFVFAFSATGYADATPTIDETYSGFGAPFAYTQYGAFGSDEDINSPAIASNTSANESPQTPSDIELQNILQIEPAAGDEAVTE